jgi:DNA-binding NtrC family response regulator
MRSIKEMVKDIANTDAIVLIQGESGVGKDVVARAIHATSARRDGPFVKVNCAALPVDLLESELFGHEQGAFTGAYRRKLGQVEYANRGTLYLDEIGELPLPMQAKLLHVLQDLRFCRIGGREPLSVDVRFIAATNRSIGAPGASDFRSDLLYRLNGFVIELPSLAERRAEIGPLARLLLARFRRRETTRAERISEAALRRLEAHAWPGNIRELRNVIERAAVLCLGEEIGPEDLLLGPGGAAAAGRAGRPSGLRLGESVGGGGAAPAGRLGAGDELAPAVAFDDPRDERARYLWALAQCAGNQTRAARLLGVSRRTFVSRLDAFAIPRPHKAPLTTPAWS